jgi:hypothetical protein
MAQEPVRLDVEPRPQVDPANYPEHLHAALEHAHGTEDDVYAAAVMPRQAHGPAAKQASRVWLPEGYHYGLHIEHRSLETAGAFTGGGNKWVWHITVSDWATVDGMYAVLRDKRAAPHLVIGGRPGLKHPVVIQMAPLDQAGRALAHPSGPDTNRADCIQVEVCAQTWDVPHFDEDHRYRAFANLVRLTNVTVDQSRRVTHTLARKFTETSRFGGQEFVDVHGHCGHMHVPGNDHTDPTTAFQGSRLMRLLEKMPHGGYKL